MKKILVLCPMHSEYKNMYKALTKRITPFYYKCVEIGIGKANAAAQTALELQNEYDLVVLVGYAAATHKFQIGEFVYPSDIRYHDVDVPEDLKTDLTEVYHTDGEDVTILTGDTFVNSSKSKALQSKYGTNIIFDMEAAAVAQICSWTNTPIYVAKIVSDIPTDPNSNFEEFVKNHTDFSQFVDFIKVLIK